MVAFDPGRITRSQTGSGSPRRTRCRSTPGSAASGSRSSKLLIQGSAGTAIRTAAPGRRASARSAASSAGRRWASGKNGTRPSAAPAGMGGDRRMPAANSDASPRIRLTMKPGDHGAIRCIQHRMRADQAGDHPAAVDVAHHHHRHVRRAGEAHVGDVARPQVDLGRAARALPPARYPPPPACGRSCPARAAAGRASSPGTRGPGRCRRRGPAPPPGCRSRSAASAAPGSCARRAPRPPPAPARPAPGRSRRHRRSRRRCWTCSAA